MAKAFIRITEEQFQAEINGLSDEELYEAHITP